MYHSRRSCQGQQAGARKREGESNTGEWVDKGRTASQRKSVESVKGSVSFSGFIEGWNLRRSNPPKLHLDNCTSNDPKTGQLRNGVLGAGAGRKEGRRRHTWKVTKQLVSGRKRRKNQANKSTGWMPRHHTPTKVVASCEKLRGAASRL